MDSARKNKSQNKKQFIRLHETLNDFVIGNGITMNTLGNEILELQANGRNEHFEKVVDSASQNQVIGNNIDDRIGNMVDSAVIAVENRMHDVTLAAMNNLVNPRDEMAVRSITGSSRNGPNNIVQNPDRIDFTRNTENTPLRLASSRLDLNIEQDEIDETRDFNNSEDGDFPASRLKYDRRMHAHQTRTGNRGLIPVDRAIYPLEK